MPRNDQVTRQWHLLRTLEASREGVTLPGLADGLPAEFSRHHRTIRRDLEALEAAGFPLLTEKVDGRGVVWKLMEWFRRVPALAFSPTELMALTFSRGLLRPLDGTQLQAALDSPWAESTIEEAANQYAIDAGWAERYLGISRWRRGSISIELIDAFREMRARQEEHGDDFETVMLWAEPSVLDTMMDNRWLRVS